MTIVLFAMTMVIYGQDKPNYGVFSGQWRSYYLSTYNEGDLKDFQALATGGKLKYEHHFGEKWVLASTVYLSLNAGIQDLTQPDLTTGKYSRYEAALFDIKDLNDPFLFLLGELFIRYKNNDHTVTVGRMRMKSPFINPQDGRMIPTLTQGLRYAYQPGKLKLQAGLFNQVAPRSTSSFYGIGESIGKYPNGRTLDGSRSHYGGNTSSDFLTVLNLEYTFSDDLEIEVWDYWVENVFHSVYLKPKVKLNEEISFSMEWLYQHRVGNGGNSVDSLRYFAEHSSNVLGFQVDHKIGESSISLSYDHIFDGGRFLFPREWGRENLFSAQKRERSEGSANNHALVAYFDHTFGKHKHKWKTILSIGHHWKPDVSHAEDNKYGLPDYTHVNLDIFWIPATFEGLRPELLITYKQGTGDVPQDPAFILNRVNMFQVNFIVNYDF